MEEIGYAALGIIPSFRDFPGKLQEGTSRHMTSAGSEGGALFGDAAGKSMSDRFGSAARSAAKLAAGGMVLAGAAAVKLGHDSVDAASTLNESLNAVNVSYGRQALGVRKLGEESALALGLSNSEFNSLAVRFSSFAQTIAGGESRKVVGTLDDLTTRAADFASVMNLDVADAAQLFQSGLAGESEPLRQYGINLSAAAVQSYAYADGIAKAGEDLTDAQKVQAAYGLIMKETQKTAGDFTTTQGELANQQRILSARWEDGKAKLGQALLPVMKEGAQFLNEKGIPAFERFSDWFVEDGMPAISAFADDARPLAKSVLPAMGDAAETIGEAFKTMAPYVTDVFDAFNDLPDSAKSAIVLGAGALAVSRKLGVGPSLTGGGDSGGGLGSKVLGRDGVAVRAASALGVVVRLTPEQLAMLKAGGSGGPAGKAAAAAAGVAATASRLAPWAVGAVAAYTAPGVFGGIGRGLKDYDESDVPAALAGSNVGKNADKFGIDLQRLAKNLEEYGDKGKYVIEVQKDLEKAGNVGIAKGLGEFISPFVHDGEKARLTLLDLEEAMRESSEGIHDWAVDGSSSLSDIMLATLKPTKGIEDLGIAVADLPKAVKVALDTPGMVESERDVKKLRREFELTEREYRMAVALSGVKEAKTSIQSLLDLARGINVQPTSTGPKDFENLLNPAGSGSGGGSRDYGRPRMTPRAGGVNFNGPVTIRPHDSREFVQDMQRRAQRAGSDGVRMPR